MKGTFPFAKMPLATQMKNKEAKEAKKGKKDNVE
jgi:hypothetical protein